MAIVLQLSQVGTAGLLVGALFEGVADRPVVHKLTDITRMCVKYLYFTCIAGKVLCVKNRTDGLRDARNNFLYYKLLRV